MGAESSSTVPTTSAVRPQSQVAPSLSLSKNTSSFFERTNAHNPLTQRAQQAYPQWKDLPGSSRRFQSEVQNEPIYVSKEFGTTYQGKFDRGFPTGWGVAHFKDGSYYQGEFVDGDAQGNGVYIFPDGSVYTGPFKASKFNGTGSLNYTEKKMVYTGEFLNGVPHGKGVEKYYDGSRYEGSFVAGQKEGEGVYTWASGQQYRGSFSGGLINGTGSLYGPDKKMVYAGKFVKGLKSGLGELKTPNGRMQGNFEKDLLQGKGTFFWDDGRVYEGNFFNSMMHGQGTIYYPTNQVAHGNWSFNHNESLTELKYDPSASSKIVQLKAQAQSILKANESSSGVRTNQVQASKVQLASTSAKLSNQL